jgi:hypothetical protein
MDLTKLDTRRRAEEGSWLHLREPIHNQLLFADDGDELGDSGERRPMRLKLLGADSDTLQKYSRGLLDDQRRQVMTEGKSFRSSDEVEDDLIALLVAATVDCENILVDGEEVEPIKAELTALYERFPWIAEQAMRRIRDRAAYLKN